MVQWSTVSRNLFQNGIEFTTLLPKMTHNNDDTVFGGWREGDGTEFGEVVLGGTVLGGGAVLCCTVF